MLNFLFLQKKSLLFFVIFPFLIFSNKLADKCDEFLQAAEKHWNFSGTALISKKGKKILCKGYGKSIYEHDITNTSDTIFRISSLTKPITAIAILHLYERGRIDLHKPIITYLPDYPKRTGKKITIHHLLTHSSGLPDYTDCVDLTKWQKHRIKPQQIIRTFKNKPLVFRPGSQFQYSHSNYILLGAIIEEVTKLNFDRYLDETFFTPLNMFSSGYDDQLHALPKRANGYSLDNKGNIINAIFVDISTSFSSSGLYGTVEDLYRFDKALDKEKILSKKLLKKAWTPHVGHYGYGWTITEKFEKKMASHSGAINGFQSTWIKFFNDDVSIIVLSNNEKNPTKILCESLAALVFNQPYEKPQNRKTITLSSSIYQNYVGKYFLSNKNEVEITTYKNRLFLLFDKKKKIELLPSSSHSNNFFCRDILDLKITFHKDSTDQTTYLTVYEKNQEFIFKKNFDDNLSK